MALLSPARVALSHLPVNSFGTLSPRNSPRKETLSRKRPIEDVDGSENPPSARKRCSSPLRPSNASEKTAKPIGLESIQDSTSINPLSPIRATTASLDRVAMENDVSQHSNHASTASSVMDYDPDDTMETQHTAATEVTQPLPSRLSQQVENLRVRLRLAQFKVETNQTNIPFAQLRLSTASTSPRDRIQDTGRDFPASEAEHTRSKSNSSIPESTLPKAQPAPDLDLSHLPSSPPLSPATEHSETAEIDEADEDEDNEENVEDSRADSFRTPALPRHRASNKRSQDALRIRAEKASEGADEEDESLTSSVLRGKAAIGLLGLRGDTKS